MQDAFSDFLIFALRGARSKKSHIKKTRLMAGFFLVGLSGFEPETSSM